MLCSWRHGETRPEWTVVKFYWGLGRLGGHQNRENSPSSGCPVLSRGWTRLLALVERAEAEGDPDREQPRRASDRSSSLPQKPLRIPGLPQPYCTYVTFELQG